MSTVNDQTVMTIRAISGTDLTKATAPGTVIKSASVGWQACRPLICRQEETVLSATIMTVHSNFGQDASAGQAAALTAR